MCVVVVKMVRSVVRCVLLIHEEHSFADDCLTAPAISWSVMLAADLHGTDE